MKSLLNRYPISLAWPRLAMSPGLVKSIVIHHSVTPTLSAHATEAEEIAWLDKIDAYHRSRGFGGIGYHICVFPSGRCYYTTNLHQWGAGVYKQNNCTYHICLIGDFTRVAPGQGQLKGAAEGTDFIDKFLEEAA
jgi:hypothetical protein